MRTWCSGNIVASQMICVHGERDGPDFDYRRSHFFFPFARVDDALYDSIHPAWPAARTSCACRAATACVAPAARAVACRRAAAAAVCRLPSCCPRHRRAPHRRPASPRCQSASPRASPLSPHRHCPLPRRRSASPSPLCRRRPPPRHQPAPPPLRRRCRPSPAPPIRQRPRTRRRRQSRCRAASPEGRLGTRFPQVLTLKSSCNLAVGTSSRRWRVRARCPPRSRRWPELDQMCVPTSSKSQ